MIRFCLILICFVLIGCEEEINTNSKNISVTACATAKADGSVVDCEVSTKSVANLDAQRDEWKKIDQTYPGPIGPDILNIANVPLFEVMEITQGGGIILRTGQVLTLAGVTCDIHELKKYLKAIFFGENPAKIYYENTGYEFNSAKYAYIWEVDKIKDFHMVGSTNETSISSGWCEPQKQEKHKYHERYQSIATAFAK